MPVEPVSEATPGWYGKVATLGDFVQRRLPADFVRTCDAWLSRVLLAGRAQHGADWLDIYLTAPVMRFAWAPGVAGGHWWFGVLMPSCDNVGRYFPLLVAQRRPLPPLDRLALDHLEAWLDHLALAATRTLAEGETAAGFEAALAAAPPWPTPGAPSVLLGAPTDSRQALAARASIGGWLHALAAQALQARFAGCSVWWRPASPATDALVEIAAGLPEAEAFARLLAAR